MVVSSRSAPDITLSFWGGALVFFGILDVLITMMAVGSGIAAELNPLVDAMIRRFSVLVLPVLKTASIGIFYFLYRTVPSPYNIGVPLGLTVLGVAVVTWNVIVVVQAIA
jgi:hypothetical protein